jgi:P-type Cu2+ transporter
MNSPTTMPPPLPEQGAWRANSSGQTRPSPAAPSDRSVCFHCASPVPSRAAFASDDGKRFCCPGCQAAYDIIRGLGVDAYYRYRRSSGPKVAAPDASALEAYDDLAVSRTFVREKGGTSRTHLHIEGIDCPACLWLIEQRASRLPGVTCCRALASGESVAVEWDASQTRLSEILRGIAALGFPARPFSDEHRRELDSRRRLVSTERLIFAVLIGMGVMHFAFAVYLSGDAQVGSPWPLWVWVGNMASAVATAALLAYPGQPFFLGAWREWRARWPGMNTLVAVGASAAFAGSLVNTIRGAGHVYFDAVAMLIPALLVSQALVLYARERALSPLDRLRCVIPQLFVRRRAGDERHVLADALQPGDAVRVPANVVFPTDCELDSDVAWIDQAVISGESQAVTRRRGERIMAGAKNGDADVWVTVTHSAEASTVQKIQRIAARALQERVPADGLAEQVTHWLVPGLIVTALVVGVVWLSIEPARALEVTLAVMVVTCPCALGLAAPSVRMLWFTQALRLGVLPTQLDRMGKLAAARVVAFDKTGTLTEGRPQLVSTQTEGGWSRDDALAVAASLAVCSDHPMVRPLRVFKRAGVDAAAVSIETGVGVRATVNGENWFLGKPGAPTHADAEQGDATRSAPSGVPGTIELRGSRGRSARFAVLDAVRPEANGVIAALRALGAHRCAVLSGDREDAVAAAASAAGVEEWKADLLPQQKLEWVRQVQQKGQTVAYVADGVNDLPALGAADVAISMFGGSPAAQKQADFLLLDGGLGALPKAWELARRAGSILHQNVFWAVGYNLVAIPVAAAGLLTPWLAAAGMALSSAIVVGNALRLRRRNV